MIYVSSDLHGCAPEIFQGLLNRAGFCDDDYLFVLGDVIDRGEHGVQLLRWMAEQPNVQLILGNHEAMLLACDCLFREIDEVSLAQLQEQEAVLRVWKRNGAGPTLEALYKLLKQQPDILEGLLDYLRDAPLYDTVEAGGRQFVLVHGGLDRFAPDKPLEQYEANDILWARPTLDTRYYEDATVIFGHTPTQFFGMQYKGRAIKTDSWICIDTGAAAGGNPMLLRLDDMREFYADR